MSDFPSFFIIATRKRGQHNWSISGFRPFKDKRKAEKIMASYKEKHDADYEYRVLEYKTQGSSQ